MYMPLRGILFKSKWIIDLDLSGLVVVSSVVVVVGAVVVVMVVSLVIASQMNPTHSSDAAKLSHSKSSHFRSSGSE